MAYDGGLIVGCGMKMYPTLSEAREWMKTVAAQAPRRDDLTLFVLPPFVALQDAQAILGSSPVLFGAQNMHWEDRGAYTGEISPLMLQECGATLVEIGHSERRAMFHETDETVSKKVQSAVRHGLRSILCVGEWEKSPGEADAFLSGQLTSAFERIALEDWPRVIVAYEPVWAIGKDRPADPDYLAERVAAIRAWIEQRNPEHAGKVALLYGGSVSLPYVREIMQIPGVQGLFIGRAALDPANFLEMARRASESYLGAS